MPYYRKCDHILIRPRLAATPRDQNNKFNLSLVDNAEQVKIESLPGSRQEDIHNTEIDH